VRPVTPRATAAGFTLLELLVVVFIVGIIAAMATLSVGTATRDRDARREAERLAALLKVAGEESQMRGRQFGLTFYGSGYEFAEMNADSGEWQPITDVEPFASHDFIPGTEVDLAVEGRGVRLLDRPPPRAVSKPPTRGDDMDTADNNKKKPEYPPPQVVIWSSGEMTPFVLRLRGGAGGPGYDLRATASGQVSTHADGA
jgi:general secretion pathway protein H